MSAHPVADVIVSTPRDFNLSLIRDKLLPPLVLLLAREFFMLGPETESVHLTESGKEKYKQREERSAK